MPEGCAGHMERAAIERAFVAFRYLLGARRTQLLEGLCSPALDACRLANALCHNERHRRALVLADGLKPIVEALRKARPRWP
jgi:hypothetical protein